MPEDRQSTPYLRVWVADIVQSCQDMTTAQFGAHVRMILHAWDRGYCPSEPAKLLRIVGDIDPAQMADVVERWSLVELEGVPGKVYVNRRLEKEREYVQAKSRVRSDAARKANEVRWGSRNGSQTDPVGIANGSQKDPIPESIIQKVITATNDNESGFSAEPRKRSSARRKDPIRHSVEEGWTGITDDDIAAWTEAYPNANVRACIAASHQWIVANPGRGPRAAYRRFLTGWMGRERSETGSRQNGSTGLQRQTSHIPADAHPDEHHLWYMTDGRTPRRIPIYRAVDGRQKWLSGGYVDADGSETPSQGSIT